jgi:hypothetical protein
MGFIDNLLNKALKATNEGVATIKENLKSNRVKDYLREIKEEVELCYGIPVEEEHYANIVKMFLNKKASEDGYWDENVDELLKNLVLFAVINKRKEVTNQGEYFDDMSPEQINQLVESIDVKYIYEIMSKRKTDRKSYLLFLAGIERNNSIESIPENAIMFDVPKNEYLTHIAKNEYNKTYEKKLLVEYPTKYYLIEDGIHPNIQKELYNFVKKRSEEKLNAIYAVLGSKLSEILKKDTETATEETKE